MEPKFTMEDGAVVFNQDDTRIATVQQGRHKVRDRLVEVAALLAGGPGLTKEQQVDRLGQAESLLADAVTFVQATRMLAEERDFDAHQSAKQQDSETV